MFIPVAVLLYLLIAGYSPRFAGGYGILGAIVASQIRSARNCIFDQWLILVTQVHELCCGASPPEAAFQTKAVYAPDSGCEFGTQQPGISFIRETSNGGKPLVDAGRG